MNKPVSTRNQARLDFATAAFAIAFPRLLGANRAVTAAVTCVALTKLSYALFTRQEYAPAKMIPMKYHLAMDCVGGVGLCAIPFVFGETKASVTACCVGMGLFDIAIAPFVQTTPSFDKAGEQAAHYRVPSVPIRPGIGSPIGA